MTEIGMRSPTIIFAGLQKSNPMPRVEENSNPMTRVEAVYICMEREGKPCDTRGKKIQTFTEDMKCTFTIVEAQRPDQADWHHVFSYGQFLHNFGIRHTHAHLNTDGALGLLKTSAEHVWNTAKWSKGCEWRLVFEENAIVRYADELRAVVTECVKQRYDYAQLHTYTSAGRQNWLVDTEDYFGRIPPGTKTRDFNHGHLETLTSVHASTKCYFISKKFAQHMRQVVAPYYPALQIDSLLATEVLFPTTMKEDGDVQPEFKSVVYVSKHPEVAGLNEMVGVDLTSYKRIAHHSPHCWNGMKKATAGAAGAVLGAVLAKSLQSKPKN